MPNSVLIQKYFEDKIKEVNARYQVTKTLQASYNKGRNREVFIQSFLKNVIPRRLHVTSGELIDHLNGRTGQIDIIIARDDAPSLEQGMENIYFVGSVFSVIEIKSRITTKELYKVLRAFRKVNSLTVLPDQIVLGNINPIPRPLKILFSYESSLSLKTINQILNSSSSSKDIDLVCVANKGVVIGSELFKLHFIKRFFPTNPIQGTTIPNIINKPSTSLALLYYYLSEFGTTFLFGSNSIDEYFNGLVDW